ncbi:hypothetical protein C6990_04515 [Nitrosopumilus sp. b3]|uniref:hypothetical protein n=1 Tax=Nitrosopumilus sp. b3 TaxID=2109909 RepID=UPI0015F4D972|nr:hypothetical protein [Nitrosopumilus sp. b3]KAF6247706.1 hypothetical protein C6990_04515 [Nitrosopumilus sp. b3]
MSKMNISSGLEEKIFDFKTDHHGVITKIVSYFPLSENQRQEIVSAIGFDFSNFTSIFSDTVSEEEWNKTKEQIKKKFHDELFDIDKIK